MKDISLLLLAAVFVVASAVQVFLFFQRERRQRRLLRAMAAVACEVDPVPPDEEYRVRETKIASGGVVLGGTPDLRSEGKSRKQVAANLARG